MLKKDNAIYTTEEREGILLVLYKSTFPIVAKFVSRRGGSFEQAKDVFHDALVRWYEKSGGPDKLVVDSDQAYIYGIARHLWYRRFSNERNMMSLDSQHGEEFENKTEDQVSSGKLLRLVETTGRKCLEMLKSFYYDKLSMTELATGFGFKSVHSATVQKYKCLEKVRETVKEKSLSYEDFLE